jgi:exosortase
VPSQIYSAMTIPLQLWVSQASTWLAGWLGVAIYSEGNVISLPHKTLEVVQACSGLRSLTTLLSLSAILGYFLLRSNALRALLIASALPISIVVNVIRVLALIICEYYFDIDLNAGPAHTAFGLVIFLLALVLIILVRGGLSFWDKSAVSK